MKQRDERSLSDRSMSDREATELDEVLFRDPNDLMAMTPPARAGEHLRWVSKEESKYRSRIATGYRPARYSEYPDFRPYKNLIAAAAVGADDVVTHKDNLVLMTTSEKLVAQRTRHYAELAHRQNVGAHQAVDIPRQPGVPITDASEHSTDIQRVRRPAQFGS
jgi:hypothetical protein